MSDAELLAPSSPDDAAPPPVAEEAPEQAAPSLDTDDDSAFDAAIAAQTIDIPDGDKLVPLSAVTGARRAIKDAKAERDTFRQQAERLPQVEQQLRQLQEQLNQALPGSQAYAALVAAQQAAPQPEQPEDTTEYEEIARDLDLYKTDGTPDIDKARRIHTRQQRVAEQVAQRHVAPVQNHAIQQQSHVMFQRAALTEVGGVKADPQVLQMIWRQLDPALTATEAGAKQALISAIGHSLAAGKTVARAAAPKADLPAPLLSEKAGGRDAVGFSMTDGDRRVARDMNMSDKEYMESASKMPWGRK